MQIDRFLSNLLCILTYIVGRTLFHLVSKGQRLRSYWPNLHMFPQIRFWMISQEWIDWFEPNSVYILCILSISSERPLLILGSKGQGRPYLIYIFFHRYPSVNQQIPLLDDNLSADSPIFKLAMYINIHCRNNLVYFWVKRSKVKVILTLFAYFSTDLFLDDKSRTN